MPPSPYKAPTDLKRIYNILRSYTHHFSTPLLPSTPLPLHPTTQDLHTLSTALWTSPRAVLAHNGTPNSPSQPVFNFVNLRALETFQYPLDEFLTLESHLSAREGDRGERDKFLRDVESKGWSREYRGVRIRKDGTVFRGMCRDVWNVLEFEGERVGGVVGQAATIEVLEEGDGSGV
ncbi:hypothetical protein HDV00_011854 [Rhizophlyctis rosea]|nr:hypothetical protein HDV00_011854 [Rhizophlyctis rosea]